jgi:hypothetical protein
MSAVAAAIVIVALLAMPRGGPGCAGADARVGDRRSTRNRHGCPGWNALRPHSVSDSEFEGYGLTAPSHLRPRLGPTTSARPAH